MTIVPESKSTFRTVEPPTRDTGFPLASVPVMLFKWTVKSTTPSKLSKPDGAKSMVTRGPENLEVSIPPKSNVPPEAWSSLVHKLKARELMYPCFTRRIGRLS